jgi:hypothetical protein
MHLEILVIDLQRSGREFNRPVHRCKSLLKKILIVVNTPPSFAVESISDVKLCRRITLGGVSALPFVSSGAKLLPTKQGQRRIKLFLVYLVSARRHLRSGGNLCKTARLGGI